MIQDPNEEQEEGGRWRRGGGGLGSSRPSFVFNTGGIELYSYLLFYCCIAEREVEVEGEEQEAAEEGRWRTRFFQT